MIEATHLKTHRRAASLFENDRSPSCRAHEGRPEDRLHAVREGKGRPVVPLLSQGYMSDHKGAALVLPSATGARDLIGDGGYDSSRFRMASLAKGIAPCIRPRRNRGEAALRLDAPPPAPPDREHGGHAGGLPRHRHPPRPLCAHLHVRRRTCRHHDLLDKQVSATGPAPGSSREALPPSQILHEINQMFLHT
ncbi:hypothetical protein NFI88_00285 [Acetobacteraceae bacterium KSS12]|uniref:Transposase IS4-like domain-containing protein n=2 Tax=Rhizosaccharibacter radicis TaxID=2782605 RepID=A0ABT1VSG0_9PROT|nr:hypothetical protein [Acetobacteraceae bacterium KSS12]